MLQESKFSKLFHKKLGFVFQNTEAQLFCSTHDFEYVEGVFKRAIVFSKDHNIIRDEDYETVIKDEQFLVDNNIK